MWGHMTALFLLFLRSFHPDCLGGHTSSPSHPQEMRARFSSLPVLTSLYPLHNSRSGRAEMELNVTLVCISPMVRNVEHFKIYLLALLISSFENCLVTCALVNWQTLFSLFIFGGCKYVCVFNLCSIYKESLVLYIF